MIEFLTLLAFLICAHFICDFPLQGDFVAKFKARIVDGNQNNFWGWVLTAHAIAHAFPVVLLTKSLFLAAIMFVTHFVIDFLKCEQKISFNQDQVLHLVVVIVIAIVGVMQ